MKRKTLLNIFVFIVLIVNLLPFNCFSDDNEYLKISIMQIQLKQFGYDPGQIDGVLGKSTKKALRDFQKCKGLKITGNPDDKTMQELGVQISKKKICVNTIDPLFKNVIFHTQNYLSIMGYYNDKINGYFNNKTKKAISKFQSDNNLKVHGYLDKETKKLLSEKVFVTCDKNVNQNNFSSTCACTVFDIYEKNGRIKFKKPKGYNESKLKFTLHKNNGYYHVDLSNYLNEPKKFKFLEPAMSYYNDNVCRSIFLEKN